MSQEEDSWWEFEEELVQGGFRSITDCDAESLLSEKVVKSSDWGSSRLLAALIEGGEEVADGFLWVDRTSGSAGAAGGTVVGVSFELRNSSTAACPDQALIKTEIKVQNRASKRRHGIRTGETFGAG